MRVSVRRAPDADDVAALAIVAATSALVFSGFSTVARVLVVIALVASVPAARHGIRTMPGALAVVTVVTLTLYGWLIGSTPDPTDATRVARWLDHDARFIFPVALIPAMCGLRRAASFVAGVRVSLAVAAAATAGALVIQRFSTLVETGGGLFIGFTSSHHVQGALALFAILVVVAAPPVVPRRGWRVGIVLMMLISLAFSGSRASTIGLAAGLGAIAIPRLGRRTLARAAIVTAVVCIVAVVAVPRVRTTTTTILSKDFVPDLVESFRHGDTGRAAALGDSEAGANILIRFALWGQATNHFIDSPLIGMGAFRFNDDVSGWTGVQGVMYVATEGRARFNDAQAHNMYLHVLAETGITGFALYFGPWLFAWRWTRGRTEPADFDTLDGDSFVPHAAVAAQSFLVAAAVVGAFAEAVLSPAVGVPAVIMVFGSATLVRSRTPVLPDAKLEIP